MTQTINESYFIDKSYEEFISTLNRGIKELSNTKKNKFTIVDTDTQNISVQLGSEKKLDSNFMIESGNEKVTISIHEVSSSTIEKVELQPLNILKREKDILINNLCKSIDSIINTVSSEYGYEIKNNDGEINIIKGEYEYKWMVIKNNKNGINMTIWLEEDDEINTSSATFDIVRQITPIINKYLRVSIDTFDIEEDYHSMINFINFITESISSDFSSNPEYDGDGVYKILSNYLNQSLRKGISSDGSGSLEVTKELGTLNIHIPLDR